MNRPAVVVVGDVVLDADVEGTVERLAPDAPVPVLDVAATRESPGGAGLAALLCAAAGARVTLVAPVAEDEWGDRLATLLTEHVELVRLGHDGATRRKTRLRSQNQSLVRVDDGGPGTPQHVPVAAVEKALAAADVVLVSDYGAGVTRDPALRTLLTAAARGPRLVWDPHPRGGAPVPGATLVTPNLAEARTAAGQDTEPPDVLAATLVRRWDAGAVCVTAGAAGAFLARPGGEATFVPAVPVTGGDPCGAGDQFAASAAAALARGALVPEAVQAAVADATAWVGAGGADGFRTRGRSRPAAVVGDAAPPLGAAGGDLERLADRLRADGGTLVATGGCFDIVHAGHVATLQAARRLGDRLVVLMNSDASVARLKGPGRPVVTAADRARVLEAFDCVDAVVVFDEDDPSAVLERLRPDVWAKGGDYGGAPLPEAEVVRAHGGRVVLLPYLGGRSTTSIIERTGAAVPATARPDESTVPPADGRTA